MKIGNFTSLRLKSERKHLNTEGVFLQSHSFNLKAIKSKKNKIFFIIKKKIGNSPIRNKIKRQLRAIISQKQTPFPLHIMFIVKPNFLTKSFDFLKKEIESCIKKISLKLST